MDRVLTRKRIILSSCIFLALYSVAYFAGFAAGNVPIDEQGAVIASDLRGYVTGSRIVLDGETSKLYSLPVQEQAQLQILGVSQQKRLNIYIAPPFVAYAYAPFVIISYNYAAVLWIVLTAVLLALSVRLLWPLVPNLHHFGYGSLMAVILASYPGFDAFATGQNSAISLLIATASLRLLLAGKDRASGALLGLGVFKPQLVVLYPVFFVLEKRWRALAAWTAVVSVLCTTSLWMIGIGGVRAYIGLLTSDFYEAHLLDEIGWKMRTVASLLRFIVSPAYLSGTIATITSFLILVAGGMLIWLSRQVILRRRSGVEAVTLSYAATVLIAVMFAPHAFNYDSILLILPFMIFLNALPQSAPLRVSIGLAYLLTSTTAWRSQWFYDLGWPLNIFAAPWEVILVLGCLVIVCRGLNEPRGNAPEPPVFAPHVAHPASQPAAR